MLKIFDRYVLKEVTGTWLAVTVVLLLILISTRFSRFLGDAAAGKLPTDIVFTLLGLTSLHYAVVLVPPAMFLAILVTLGRLYRDNELAAAGGCGIADTRLYRPLYALGLIVATVVASLSLYFTPMAAQKAYQLRQEASHSASVGIIEPRTFKQLGGGGAVIYVGDIASDGNEMRDIYVYQSNTQPTSKEQPNTENLLPNTVTAERGYLRQNPVTGERVLVLKNGYRYVGKPGQADYQEMQFEEHGVYFQLPKPDVVVTKRSAKTTSALLDSTELADKAEFQWRISYPISVLILVLLALPLGKIQPRQGRYAKLMAGVLIYIIYFNVLGVAQAAIEKGNLPPLIGMWPVHLIALSVALVMLKRNGSIGFSYAKRKRQPKAEFSQ